MLSRSSLAKVTSLVAIAILIAIVGAGRAVSAESDAALPIDVDAPPSGDLEVTERAGYVWALVLGYGTLIVAASFMGGWLPTVVRLTHTRMQLMISFVGGLMLGIAFFHLLPHSVGELHSLERSVYWLVGGLLGTFFLIRAFQFHQHAPAEANSHSDGHVHGHSHGHEGTPNELSALGVALGLSLHTLIDGMALGASVQVESANHQGPLFAGMGTFLAIVLHKPLEAVSIVGLMGISGWTARSRFAVNLGFALMCPLGAIAVLLGADALAEYQHEFVGSALGLATGAFLCISLGDLLPEVHFHAHDRVKLSAALLAGIALAFAISRLEPAHSHVHQTTIHSPVAGRLAELDSRMSGKHVSLSNPCRSPS